MSSTDFSKKQNDSNVKYEVLQRTIKDSFSRISGKRLETNLRRIAKRALYLPKERES